MNITKICSLGYFDKVVVDGYMIPMYNTKGIQVDNNESLVCAMNTNDQSYTHGIGKLRFGIYGEIASDSRDKISIENKNHIENELKLCGTRVDNFNRYSIAYLDILILKSDYSFPFNVSNKGKTKEDLTRLAKSEDERVLFTKALDIQKEIIKKSKEINDCSIAIANRVFVNKTFRQCGISNWLHSNLRDIIRVYSMSDVAVILLVPGDFNDEAEKNFGMTKEGYRDMLIQHYTNNGYKFIDKYIMYKSFVDVDIKKRGFLG